MKLRKFWAMGGGGATLGEPPPWIRQWVIIKSTKGPLFIPWVKTN